MAELVAPAAVCFTAEVLYRPLTPGRTYLVTAHADPGDPTRVRFSYVGLPPAAVDDLPGYLHGLAPAAGRAPVTRASVVGYGIAWPSLGRVVMVDRHGQLGRVRPPDTPPTLTGGEEAVARALTAVMAAGPGLIEPAPVGRDTTARTGRRRVPPGRRRVAGVFAPTWAYARDRRGRWYARFGYHGTPLPPNTGMVFACTEAVATAILTDHQLLAEEYTQVLRRTGHYGAVLDRAVDTAFGIIDRGTHLQLQGGPTGPDRDDHAVLRRTTRGVVQVGGPVWRCVAPDACEHLTV